MSCLKKNLLPKKENHYCIQILLPLWQITQLSLQVLTGFFNAKLYFSKSKCQRQYRVLPPYRIISERMLNVFSSSSVTAIFWPSADPDGERNWKILCPLSHPESDMWLCSRKHGTWQTMVNTLFLFHRPMAPTVRKQDRHTDALGTDRAESVFGCSSCEKCGCWCQTCLNLHPYSTV